MEVATSKIFLDRSLPDENTRSEFVARITKFFNQITLGFQSMIEQTQWMSTFSKRSAYEKLSNLYVNVGFTALIANNSKLIDYYKELSVEPKDNYFDVLEKLRVFDAVKSLKYLLIESGTERDALSGNGLIFVSLFCCCKDSIFLFKKF